MALGDFNLFSWKSKAAREKESREYEQWAFPYGAKQREKLTALMSELCPKEPPEFMLMSFLTCKELYGNCLEKTGSSRDAIEILVVREKKYKNIIKKTEMTRYIALVLADAKIDENCEYETAQEIQARISELDALKR